MISLLMLLLVLLQVYYAVKVDVQTCASSSDADCKTSSVVLNPNAPSASASDGAFYASLVGDLVAFDAPPDLTDMVLAVPAGSSASNCNGANDPQVSRCSSVAKRVVACLLRTEDPECSLA